MEETTNLLDFMDKNGWICSIDKEPQEEGMPVDIFYRNKRYTDWKVTELEESIPAGGDYKYWAVVPGNDQKYSIVSLNAEDHAFYWKPILFPEYETGK